MQDTTTLESGTRRLGRTLLLMLLASFALACADPSTTPDARVATIRIQPASLALAATSDSTLTATAYDADGRPLPDANVTWSSSHSTIARVSPNGGVLALQPGSATLTAASEGKSASALVQVVPFTNYDLIFERVVDDRVELWLTDLNGGQERRLFAGVAAAEPTPSPDGSQIAFVRYGNAGAEADIYVIGRDGQGLRRLTDAPGVEQHPAWSPDGSRILFRAAQDGTSDIWVMNANGTNRRNLTEDQLPVVIDKYYPAWTHDGSRIAYIRTLGDASDIWVMNADGSGKVQWSTTDAHEARPVWSPNGAYLAFAQRKPGQSTDIAIVSRTGHDVVRLELPGEQGTPAWSPDSRLLAFSSLHEGQRAIYALHINTLDIVRRTVGGAGDSHPAWLKRR